MTIYRFIEPVDVLYLRGNRLFGGAGDHAEALMPPWPSLFAGAIRSRMLADHGVDLGRLTEESDSLEPPELGETLGTPSNPGTFRVSLVTLARKNPTGRTEPLFRLAEDLKVTKNGTASTLHRFIPVTQRKDWGIRSSSVIPMTPALRPFTQVKPESGYWMTVEAFETYLSGRMPDPDKLVSSGSIWQTDSRVGIARRRDSGTADEGKIYTTETVALTPGFGFIVAVEGCPDSLVPSEGLLRLGGDGRGARIDAWDGPLTAQSGPEPGENFTLYLTTPGLFPNGWLPPGVDPDTMRLEIDGLTARLAAAAVPRHQVVSGWDIAAHRPKPAQRTVSAGSMYFFDQVEGDPIVYPKQLWKQIERELGDGWDSVWKQRRAEGFSNILLGRWPEGGA